MNSADKLICIPVTDSDGLVGQILYESGHFKDVVLIGIIGGQGTFDISSPIDGYLDCFWVGLAPIKDGYWKVIGRKSVGDIAEYTRCIVAGWIWELDQEIRPANKDDYLTVPRFLPHPRLAAEERCRRIHIN